MLAFTVQFSSYGRDKGPLGASAPCGPRPFESAPYGCFLRTQQRARSSFRCLPSFRCPLKENVLTGQSQESEPNNQCSTRKHGRPATHTVTRGARCSLERR